jgi:hypothetical protein
MGPEFLLKKQNPDGGWAYLHGGSWTEPSVYATLALLAAGETRAAQRGIDWLIATERPGGGWASRPGIGESTWVTALAALVPEERIGREAHQRAIAWLMNTRGEDTTAIYTLRLRLLGLSPSTDYVHPGWPWTKGAAAWVSPTSAAVLALDLESRRRPSPEISERVKTGRQFLLAHTCVGGGWNHGSIIAWDENMSAYPETTGLALLAMRGVRAPQIDISLAAGQKFLDTRSADAQNWLRLGLSAHNRLPANYEPPAGIAYRTVPEVALNCLFARGGLA